MTSLVVGSDGLIGRSLTSHLLKSGGRVLTTTRRVETVTEGRLFLDLEQDVTGWSSPIPLSVAYLCAAVTALQYCSANPVRSAQVNVDGTLTLAQKLVSGGTFVIGLSTNLVFDGSIARQNARDPVRPRTEYGKQKAKMEAGLSCLGGSVAIVRLTKVVAPEMPLFRGWITALLRGEAIRPFSNVMFAPVSVECAVRVLIELANSRSPGIWQVSPEGELTYEEAARYIGRRIGAPSHLIQPITWQQSGLDLEAVPIHTTLDTSRLRSEFDIELPDAYSMIDTMLGS